MAQEIINNGLFDNDPSADTLRAAFEKTNDNFTELYGFANNQALWRNLGMLPGDGPVTAAEVADRVNNGTLIIGETRTPVCFEVSKMNGDSAYRYVFIFTSGKGNWGLGGTLTIANSFRMMSVTNTTPENVTSDPNASVQNLDPVTDGDFITKANASAWDFGDSGEAQPDGGVKSYYFSYTDDGVLYFALFKAAPGVYGLGHTPFILGDFVITTNSNVTPERTKLSEFENDVPFINTVETITDLENYSGTSTTVVVNDKLRGGTFTYVASGLTADNGTVFTATGKGSGYWQRQWNVQNGVNILWYGADPTGVNDCAVIIEDVISNYSQSGKVFIPAGNYRVTTTIGDVGVGSTKHITNNVTVSGTLGTNIIVDSPTQISSVIGFDIRGVDLVFENLNLIGNNKANRGIYIRQQLQDAPSSRRSNLIVKNCSISDMFGTTGNIESSVVGIAVYGYFESVFVYDNSIKNITTDSATLPVKGMFTAGSSANGVPINSKVFRNNIRNVSRSNTSSLLDQDGIHISGLSVNNSIYKSEVWGNTIYDCRGRMIKTQTFNNSIYDNFLIINDSYQMPASHDGSAINVQYSDANVFNNTLIHRNTDNNNFNAMVGFIERTTDAHEHRMNVYGNRVFASGMKYFITLWEDNQAMLGVLNCYDNVIDTTVESFMWYLGYNTTPTQRNVNLKGNVIKSVTNPFINSNINQITFNLDYNINRGTAVAASNAANSLFLTNNVGITNPNSYALTASIRPYKSYMARITQAGTSAPVASIVLENGLSGAIVLSRTAVGSYLGTLAGAFTLNKTVVLAIKDEGSASANYRILTTAQSNTNAIQIVTKNSSDVDTDGLLAAFIEVRVYN